MRSTIVGKVEPFQKQAYYRLMHEGEALVYVRPSKNGLQLNFGVPISTVDDVEAILPTVAAVARVKGVKVKETAAS